MSESQRLQKQEMIYNNDGNLSKINSPESTQRKETMFSSEHNLHTNFKQQIYLMITFTLCNVLSELSQIL